MRVIVDGVRRLLEQRLDKFNDLPGRVSQRLVRTRLFQRTSRVDYLRVRLHVEAKIRRSFRRNARLGLQSV